MAKWKLTWEKWDMLQPGKNRKYIQINIAFLIQSSLSNLHISERIEVYTQTLVLSHICIFLDVRRYNHFSPCKSCFSVCTLRF